MESPVPMWVLYIVIFYSLLGWEVHSSPSFLENATAATVQADAARVVAAAVGWIAVVGLVQYGVPLVAPASFAKGLEITPDRGLKPATMCVSWIHSCTAVAIGANLLLPSIWSGEWKWYEPMSDNIANYIAMFTGYQICDTVLGWRGLSEMHKVHHFAGLLAWGFPLFTRSECTIAGLAYLLAEVPNPFLHLRWLLKHWKADDTTFAKVNEYIFVLAWMIGRNVPELYVCYTNAWFDSKLPLAWRATIAIGNMLTLVWSGQIFQMLYKIATGQNKQKPKKDA